MENEYISRARVREIIGDVKEVYPYKLPGNHATYSPYNEGWQDACSMIESMIDAEDGAEVVPLDYHERCLELEVERRIQAERPNHVLTMAELTKHCVDGAESTPLWLQWSSNRADRWAPIGIINDVFYGAGTIMWYLKNWPNTYNKTWRCWLRKPTVEEMQKEAWER